MILQLFLLQIIIIFTFFFFLPPPAFPFNLTLKPCCLDRCGNLPIPYPFGVGQDCSLDPSFNIICDTHTNPPKPYLSIYDGMEVVEIKPSQVRVTNPYLLSVACYSNKFGSKRRSTVTWTGISLRRTQYTFSNENWLTAIGCDDLVLGIGEGKQRFGGGCISYCNDSSDSSDYGVCPSDDMGYQGSYGCCRNPVPRGLAMLGVQFIDLSRKWRDRKLFPCSYAFITEKRHSNQSDAPFSFPLSYLNNSTSFVDDNWRNTKGALPVVRLDWRIGNENCTKARRNSTIYACRENAECVDIEVDVKGYLCRCRDGYHGNPYLKCQDINECDDNPCDSNSVCINTSGSFVCSCPQLHYGDGRKEGKGCIPSKVIYVLIGVVSGLGILLLLSTCLFWHKKLQTRKSKRRKEKFFEQNGGLLLLQNHTNEGIQRKAKLFSMEELEKATDNFNRSRIIGRGGQGSVYKGMLSDGNIAAIKKSKLINKVRLEQFINEVVILSQINHRNVVKLLGCCLETEVPLLVYELMPNGTLFDLIHEPTTEFPVSWNMRLKMAADIAGAIMYLHSASSSPIYHRDIKSSNILLDEKYVVKLSDFGISVFVAEDQTHLTTLAKGTIGYCDPEYFQSNQFTEKSDVYSFGVVLLELLTGQRPVSSERMEERSLVIRFLDSIQENNLDAILDSRVLEEGVKKEMVAVALLAQRCLSLNGKMRPTMKEVATNLESLRMSQSSQMQANFDDKSEERGLDRPKSVKISDSEYTWAGSLISETSSSEYTFLPKTV